MSLKVYLTREQMNLIAEKTMDLGNLFFAGMVITQLIPGGGFHLGVIMEGVGGGALCYWGAYFLLRRAQL